MGMLAALALAFPLRSNAAIVIGGFEGAGRTAEGKGVVVSAMQLGGTTKGMVIIGGKVVTLQCAMFERRRTATGAPALLGGTLYAYGKALGDPSTYVVKAVDNGADEFGFNPQPGPPGGPLCGAASIPTAPIKSGQFVGLPPYQEATHK